MKFFQSISFLVASTLLASTASAQYAIDPSSVINSTRDAWCSGQMAQCPLICLQTTAASATTDSNTCDPNSLTFSCVCSNGLSPNISEYSQTLPYYICQEWGNQCVSNCGSNSDCANSCRADHPCGALHPTRANSTGTLTTTAGASTTSGADAGATTDAAGQVIYTGLAGAGPTQLGGSHQTGGAASLVRVWALGAGQTFGSLAVVGAFIGGFAVLL